MSKLPSYSSDDLLWQHIKTVPAFRALLRSVEARYFRCLELREPVLDIGCGDGHFARYASDSPLTAGIDPWRGPLKKARRTLAHQLVIQGLGNKLPFSDGHFATVISNSVLEHIEEVQPVLAEASRVLRTNGRLIITVPSHYFTQQLGGAMLLEKLRFHRLANTYRLSFNKISRHAHTDPPEKWAERLAATGFVIQHWQYYFSKSALHQLELGHIQGLPSALIHALTGSWIVAPWRSNLFLTERWLRPYYDEKAPSEGTMILIVARKVENAPASAVLPDPDPLDIRC